MPNSRVLRYAVVALTAIVVVVVLVWRDNPLESDVDTAEGPAPSVSPTSSTSSSTTTTERETTSTTSPTSTSSTTTSTTTTSTTTTTIEPDGVAWPDVPESGEPAAVVTPTGVVLPVRSSSGDSFEALSPCGNQVTVTGEPLYGANVVLDPGHGGHEPGAVGPNGLREDNVNLYVAQAAAAYLEREGATVVVTRSDDYDMQVETRTELALALQPQLFISVHHNADADGRSERPGTETFFQIGSTESRRAAGLIWEELVDAMGEYDAKWDANRDAGAKSRAASDGGDLYGILRLSAGVPAVIVEALFLDNPSEAELLRQTEVLDAEGRAIADAVIRYLDTDDPGSGYVEAKPREDGPPGAAPPCDDPSLG